MKPLFLAILLGFITLIGVSQVNPYSKYQRGYIKKNGTYVRPHYKTKTNKTNLDNYSTKPNVDPYTGKKGYKAKDYSPEAYHYGSGKPIYSGSKGGQYYYNSKGHKVYVPKR
jgi:hypothetical protein